MITTSCEWQVRACVNVSSVWFLSTCFARSYKSTSAAIARMKFRYRCYGIMKWWGQPGVGCRRLQRLYDVDYSRIAIHASRSIVLFSSRGLDCGMVNGFLMMWGNLEQFSVFVVIEGNWAIVIDFRSLVLRRMFAACMVHGSNERQDNRIGRWTDSSERESKWNEMHTERWCWCPVACCISWMLWHILVHSLNTNKYGASNKLYTNIEAM